LLTSDGSIEWRKSLGGTKNDEATAVQLTSDGGYIVAGISYSFNNDATNNYDYWIVKLTSSGIVEWQKNFGGSKHEFARAIRQTEDGGYIVAGRTDSNDRDVTGNHGDFDCWIIKLTADGDLMWQKTLGGGNGDEARDVQRTSDGGYIVVGATNSIDGDVTNTHGLHDDFWIVKLNNNGDIEWQKTLGGFGSDAAFSIQNTSDNGYIVAGHAISNDGNVTGNHGHFDYWVVKLNNNGDLEWQKCLGGSNRDDAHTIQQTKDGGYIVCGYSSSNNGDVTGNYGKTDYWIAKLAPSVLTVNLINFNPVAQNNMVRLSWRIVPESNTYFILERSGDAHFQNSNESNLEIARINSSGDSLQSQTYFYTDSTPLKGSNFYRLKLVDKNGNHSYSTIVLAVISHSFMAKFYPNPVQDVLNFRELDSRMSY
jgi:hypothetical protein